MWIITKDGFFSVASASAYIKEADEFSLIHDEHIWEGHNLNKEDYLLIRSRDRWGLEQVRQRVLGPHEEGVWTGEIITDIGTDYEERMIMPRFKWAMYLQTVAHDIDYKNFKPACHDNWEKHLGNDIASSRSSAMLSMWWVLYDMWDRNIPVKSS